MTELRKSVAAGFIAVSLIGGSVALAQPAVTYTNEVSTTSTSVVVNLDDADPAVVTGVTLNLTYDATVAQLTDGNCAADVTFNGINGTTTCTNDASTGNVSISFLDGSLTPLGDLMPAATINFSNVTGTSAIADAAGTDCSNDVGGSANCTFTGVAPNGGTDTGGTDTGGTDTGGTDTGGTDTGGTDTGGTDTGGTDTGGTDTGGTDTGGTDTGGTDTGGTDTGGTDTGGTDTGGTDTGGTPVDIPTMSEWAMMLTVFLLVIWGLMKIRRRDDIS